MTPTGEREWCRIKRFAAGTVGALLRQFIVIVKSYDSILFYAVSLCQGFSNHAFHADI